MRVWESVQPRLAGGPSAGRDPLHTQPAQAASSGRRGDGVRRDGRAAPVPGTHGDVYQETSAWWKRDGAAACESGPDAT